MKLLVIGGPGGQVAGALAALNSPALEVVALGRPDADLTRPDTLAAALARTAPDSVVCAGAFTAVDEAESRPDLAFAVNAEGPAALARQCAAADIPLVHLSTDYVFDGQKAGAYGETDVTSPLNVYGRSKLAGERGVAEASGRFVILRASWVYGPAGRNFVRTMLRLAAARERIGVVEDQFGSPTSAADLAGAVARICALMAAGGGSAPQGLYHLSGQGRASWRDLAQAALDGARRRGGPWADIEGLTTAQYPAAARRPANSELSSDLIAEQHGIRLPPWRESLERCLDDLARTGWPAGADRPA